MNALSQAADLRSQAHTLAEQALFGDLFADVSTETIAQLHAQADALEAQAVVAPAPAPAPRGAGWRAKFSPNAEYYERSKTNILRAIQGTIKGAEAHSRKEALIAHESQYNSHVQKLAALKAKALRDGVVISYTVPVYPDSLKWVEPAPEPSPAEQLNQIFDELLSPVSEPAPRIPAHDDDELLSQWRDANRAGEGRAFGDPDDLTCEADVYEAAEIETARVVCELDTPNCYLVSWSDDYHVVCDANGWWACRVSL